MFRLVTLWPVRAPKSDWYSSGRSCNDPAFAYQTAFPWTEDPKKAKKKKEKNLTTKKESKQTATTIGSLSNHDDDGNKNPTNLHILQ